MPRWARLEREEPAQGAGRGARAGAPAVAAVGRFEAGREAGPRRAVRAAPRRRRGAVLVRRRGGAWAASRPAGGRLWLRAEEPVERPGQRLRRDGGGGGRCPRRSRSRCWRKT